MPNLITKLNNGFHVYRKFRDAFATFGHVPNFLLFYVGQKCSPCPFCAGDNTKKSLDELQKPFLDLHSRVGIFTALTNFKKHLSFFFAYVSAIFGITRSSKFSKGHANLFHSSTRVH